MEMSDFDESHSGKGRSNLGTTKAFSTLEDDGTGSLVEKIGVHTIRSTPGNMAGKLAKLYEVLETLTLEIQQNRAEIQELKEVLAQEGPDLKPPMKPVPKSPPQPLVVEDPARGFQLSSYRERTPSPVQVQPTLTVNPYLDPEMIFSDDSAGVIENRLVTLQVRIPYLPEGSEFLTFELPGTQLTKTQVRLSLQTGEEIRALVEGSQLLVDRNLIPSVPNRLKLE